ncbi:MAG: DUF6036 family nucleotidyltransferase [Planctomycetota bacterium]|jgi:hypothetical protein
MQTLDNWNSLMPFRVKLIACGGTAMTLLNIKESTKDIDFIVPIESQHDRLMTFLREIGYDDGKGGLQHPEDPNFIYQFWRGNQVFTTQLLESVLSKGNHSLIKKWSHIYLGVLNLLDLIITKMFRGTSVDVEDCISVFKTGNVDPELLLERYANAALYDLNPLKMITNYYYFSEKLSHAELVDEKYLTKVKQKIEDIKARP